MKHIGAMIKEKRLEKNLTLKELGEKVSLTQGHLSNIENSHRKASNEDLIKLSKVLDIDLSTIPLYKGYWKDKHLGETSKLMGDTEALHYDIYINFERSNRHKKLEDFFSKNENVYLSESLLTEEEKLKAIKILQLVFDKRQKNYPSIEDVEKEIELESEREIEERKLEILEELIELGEVDKEDFEFFDLDDIELDPSELKEIKEPWRS